MKASQKINAIFRKIEDRLCEDPIPLTRDIADSIAMNEGMAYREFNSMFQYLTGTSLLDYITGRRMSIAYEVLISKPEYDTDESIVISGYSDIGSFTKEFKKRFNTTPKAAFAKKDESLITGCLSWGSLSEFDISTAPLSIEEVKTMETTYLGIPKEDFSMFSRARDLQVLYKFNDDQADAAFRIAKRYKVTIDQAFDFVEAYCIYWYSDDIASILGTFDSESKARVVGNGDLLYAYCTLHLPISEALSIRDELNGTNHGLTDLSKDILEAAKLHPDLPYGLIIDCFQAAEQYPGAPDMTLVLQAVEDGLSVDDAIDSAEEQMDWLMGNHDDFDIVF